MVIAAALAASSLLALSCGGGEEAERAKPDPLSAVVTGLSGGLQVRPAGSDAWLAGSMGMPLYQRDMLLVGAGANLLLSFPDGRALMAGPGTIFSFLPGSGPAGIRLDRGQLQFESPGESGGTLVESPSAEAEAEGASFDITVAPGGNTLLRVANGAVSFSSGGKRGVTVGASEQSEAPFGGTPSAPVRAAEPAADRLMGGCGGLVRLHTDRYFAYEESRDNAETEARSRLSIDPTDAWAYVNLGRALLDSGSNADAGDEFARAVEADPRLPQAHCGLGKVALVEGDWPRAAAAYEEARRADRGSLEAAFGLGLAALGAGDTAGAGRFFKEALDIDSQDAPSWVALGFIKLLENEPGAAASDMDTALEIDPDQWRGYLGGSIASLLARDRKGALAELEGAAGSGGADGGVLACLGAMSLRDGDAGTASAYFRRLQDAGEPWERAAGFQNAGAVSLAKGKRESALRDFAKSREILPVDGCLFNGSVAAMDSGQTGPSVEYAAAAVGMDPSCWYGYELQARAYLRDGRPLEAATAAAAALGLNPGAWVARVTHGIALASTGASVQARSEFESALARGKGAASTAAEYGFLGAAFQGTGKFEEALAAFRRASRISRADGSFHRLAGDALAALGRDAEAQDEYREAMRLDPGDTDARVSLAEALRAENDRSGAERVLLDGIDRDPGGVELRRALAANLLEDGDPEGALVHLRAARDVPGLPAGVLADLLVLEGNANDHVEAFQPAVDAYSLAVSSDPGRGDAWFYMAGDLERLGRPAEALAAYSRALELCRGRPEWQKFHAESADKINQLK